MHLIQSEKDLHSTVAYIFHLHLISSAVNLISDAASVNHVLRFLHSHLLQAKLHYWLPGVKYRQTAVRGVHSLSIVFTAREILNMMVEICIPLLM